MRSALSRRVAGPIRQACHGAAGSPVAGCGGRLSPQPGAGRLPASCGQAGGFEARSHDALSAPCAPNPFDHLLPVAFALGAWQAGSHKRYPPTRQPVDLPPKHCTDRCGQNSARFGAKKSPSARFGFRALSTRPGGAGLGKTTHRQATELNVLPALGPCCSD